MREKISWKEINRDNCTVISAKDISESRDRIRKEMKPIVRKFIKDSVQSEMDAKNLIINT